MLRSPIALPAAAALLAAVLFEPVAPDVRYVAVAVLLRSDSVDRPRRAVSAVRSLVGAALVAGAFSALWHEQAADIPNSAVHTRRFACTVLGDVQSTGASSSFVRLLDEGRAVLV
ncbi:MAG: hypothetical protein M3Y18_03865 [Candidatus Eremiobacteraeota bacterium]|nr:hypothetical protein [Candidatus Eremiobacteraeota bacterium]